MKKLIINHFVHNPNFSNGVTNYIRELNNVLDGEYITLDKPYSMSMSDFRTYISNFIKGQSLSIIECAESQSPSLYLTNDVNVHIRMHCPYYLYKKVINEKPDETRFSDEVRAMYKAKAISSPSYGMLELLKDELNIDQIHVYKNPIQKKLNFFVELESKTIDVLLLSRFNKLKGNEYIDDLIQCLPSHYKIVIAGKQEEPIKLRQNYPNVTILDHVEGDKKFQLLANAKVAISLSKFENCSMAILEALSVGTPVVAWDVGGNAEMAPPNILRVAQLGNIKEFVSLINLMSTREYLVKDFESVLDILNDDFYKGIKHVEEYVLGNISNVYKGIDFRPSHRSASSVFDISHMLNNEIVSPVNILLVTSTIASAKYFHKFYQSTDNFVNLSIAYQGGYWKEIKHICEYNIPRELSNTANLEQAIKNSKASIIIMDSSYPILMNDIYALQKKLKIKVLFSEKSLIRENSYSLNENGFLEKSKLNTTRLKFEPKLLAVQDKKVLVWAHQLQNCGEIDFNKLEVLLSNYNQVDFIGNIQLFNQLSEYKDLALLDYVNLNPNDYSTIISCSDFRVVDFFGYANTIYLVNKLSVFSNKNIEVEVINQGSNLWVDVSSRDSVRLFLESHDISSKQTVLNHLLNSLMLS